MNIDEIKDFLDFNVDKYYKKDFILDDPIQVPHNYNKLQDIEISAFLTSCISWGNRKQIVKSAHKLMNKMGESPYDFVMSYKEKYKLDFIYRTFNSLDLDYFIRFLKKHYMNSDTLETAFKKNKDSDNTFDRISNFRKYFLHVEHEKRSEKHLSNPDKNSASKRINMFLRWMVRENKLGVDFGLWKSFSPSELNLPLDVHSGNTARNLGILTRKQSDRKSVEEIMTILKKFNSNDPVIYDFALFGLGIYENFKK